MAVLQKIQDADKKAKTALQEIQAVERQSEQAVTLPAKLQQSAKTWSAESNQQRRQLEPIYTETEGTYKTVHEEHFENVEKIHSWLRKQGTLQGDKDKAEKEVEAIRRELADKEREWREFEEQFKKQEADMGSSQQEAYQRGTAKIDTVAQRIMAALQQLQQWKNSMQQKLQEQQNAVAGGEELKKFISGRLVEIKRIALEAQRTITDAKGELLRGVDSGKDLVRRLQQQISAKEAHLKKRDTGTYKLNNEKNTDPQSMRDEREVEDLKAQLSRAKADEDKSKSEANRGSVSLQALVTDASTLQSKIKEFERVQGEQGGLDSRVQANENMIKDYTAEADQIEQRLKSMQTDLEQVKLEIQTRWQWLNRLIAGHEYQSVSTAGMLPDPSAVSKGRSGLATENKMAEVTSQQLRSDKVAA